jgi:hypothetical protein
MKPIPDFAVSAITEEEMQHFIKELKPAQPWAGASKSLRPIVALSPEIGAAYSDVLWKEGYLPIMAGQRHRIELLQSKSIETTPTSWCCRILGHRWARGEVVFATCARCGRENPNFPDA